VKLTTGAEPQRRNVSFNVDIADNEKDIPKEIPTFDNNVDELDLIR